MEHIVELVFIDTCQDGNFQNMDLMKRHFMRFGGFHKLRQNLNLIFIKMEVAVQRRHDKCGRSLQNSCVVLPEDISFAVGTNFLDCTFPQSVLFEGRRAGSAETDLLVAKTSSKLLVSGKLFNCRTRLFSSGIQTAHRDSLAGHFQVACLFRWEL